MDKCNELIQLIDSVKVGNSSSDVMLLGDKESFDKLRQANFPLDDFKHEEVSYIDSAIIFIIPTKDKPIKICFEGGARMSAGLWMPWAVNKVKNGEWTQEEADKFIEEMAKTDLEMDEFDRKMFERLRQQHKINDKEI